MNLKSNNKQRGTRASRQYSAALRTAASQTVAIIIMKRKIKMIKTQLLPEDYKSRLCMYIPKCNSAHTSMFTGFAYKLLFIVIALCGATTQSYAQQAQALLDSIEVRLHDVHEKGIYWPKYANVRWLPDGSGYIKTEGEDQFKVDIISGDETKINEEEIKALEKNRKLSPNQTMEYEYRDGNLFVRSASGDDEYQITNNERPDEVNHSKFSWSPDGQYLAFVEQDKAEVRIRADLLGDEPSYPSLRKEPFARVGGKIEKYRVGIAHVNSNELKWVQLDSPEEGFYLGQVEWSNDELTIELNSLHYPDIINLYGQSDNIYTQSYLDKSTRFAWLTYGGELNYLSGGTTQQFIDGVKQGTDFGSTLMPRLTIDGIHFWGHADFYVTFPLSFLTLQDKPRGLNQLEFSKEWIWWREALTTPVSARPSVKPWVWSATRPTPSASSRSTSKPSAAIPGTRATALPDSVPTGSR